MLERSRLEDSYRRLFCTVIDLLYVSIFLISLVYSAHRIFALQQLMNTRYDRTVHMFTNGSGYQEGHW
jgi:hypothetical protein